MKSLLGKLISRKFFARTGGMANAAEAENQCGGSMKGRESREGG
jgi:hypothetical protein